jgi:alpha-L-rhamnosidase
MFGSISAWFFRWLGGIQVADDAVAFDRVEIRPQAAPGLEWVKCSHRSVRGLIESNWTTTPEKSQFDILIPPDTSALIVLPARPGDKLTEGGRPIGEVGGIEMLESGASNHQMQVGSGRYQFTVTRQP